MEAESLPREGGNDPASPLHEEQPIVAGEVSHGSSELRSPDLQVVPVEEVRWIGKIGVQYVTIVAEGGRSVDGDDSKITLRPLLGIVWMFLTIVESSD